MKYKANRFLKIVCILLMTAVCAMPLNVSAATKQAVLVEKERPGDLAVMFQFDEEVVDIVFISPDGTRYSSGDDSVQYASGELWATYRITDAAVGTWSVEYDLKANSGIDYSIIEDDLGLWIQYVEIREQDSENMKVAFQADYDSEDIYYNYELSALSAGGDLMKLKSGMVKSNEETLVDVSLKTLSSGEYNLQLDVFYQAGSAEVFDTVSSEAFSHTNPNEADAMEYVVYVNSAKNVCEVNWEANKSGFTEEYQLLVKGDDKIIYDGVLVRDTKKTSVVYPEGTKNLQIELSYKSNDLWSKAGAKTVNLEQEYLRSLSGDVTGSTQAVMEYKTSAETDLKAVINGQEGSYRISGEGTIAFDMQEGVNEVSVYFAGADNVYYLVETEIYQDAYPPEIRLYEELDGKQVNESSIMLLGKVVGGNKLLINEKEQPLTENGEFQLEVNLNSGENVITLEAADINGNASKMSLTIYRGGGIAASDSAGWKSFIPLVAGLAVSVVLIIGSIFFMKKKVKETKKAGKVMVILRLVLVGILEILLIAGFVMLQIYVNSIDFLETVEKSVSTSIMILRAHTILMYAAIGGMAVFVICLVITIMKLKKRKKEDSKILENN